MTDQLQEKLPGQGSPDLLAPKPAQRAPRVQNLFIGVAILIGAFLLFQVQLVIAKYILPWFGGTPAVWTACLLFFQTLLLAGYGYSHFLALRLPQKKQSMLHSGLLITSVGLLAGTALLWPSPITPGAGWKPQGELAPTVEILRFLIISVGLPFFILSTTSPLLQHWFAVKNPGASPYRLYSLSNLGSLLGLLSYPFFVEPTFHLRTQAWLWSVGYFLFAAVCLATVPWSRAGNSSGGSSKWDVDSQDTVASPPRNLLITWVALAACASAMLLASTNLISQQVAVVPFLWVLPLCLYLLSFILCFEYPRFYRRGVFHPLFALAAVATCLVQLGPLDTPLLQQLVVFLLMMFACCMICHGEIALTKPAPRHLTRFYLCVSLGGAIGGAFVAVVAPMIFPNLWEFPLGIIATGVLLLATVRQDRGSWWFRSLDWMPLALFAGVLVLIPPVSQTLGIKVIVPSALTYRVLAGVLAVCAAGVFWVRRGQSESGNDFSKTRASALAALIVLALGFFIQERARMEDSVEWKRNFYGALAVVRSSSPVGEFLFLRDRMVDHGMQFTNPALSHQAVGYYGNHSGINLFLRNLPAQPVRVGVVGLGTGTLTVFSRPSDVFRFYEINPSVLDFAYGPDAYFTYLRDSRGAVEMVLGDARLSLEREVAAGQRQDFDLLVLDAFSGDAIPIHLLTREAFELYMQHLRSPEAVIAVHITNRTLDLSPVVAGIAKEFGLSAVRVYRPWLGTFSSQTDWVFLSKSPAALLIPEVTAAGRSLTSDRRIPTWTDDHSNLLHVVK